MEIGDFVLSELSYYCPTCGEKVYYHANWFPVTCPACGSHRPGCGSGPSGYSGHSDPSGYSGYSGYSALSGYSNSPALNGSGYSGPTNYTFPLPENLVFANGGVRCDVLIGPCACGAYHNLADLGDRLANNLISILPLAVGKSCPLDL